MTMTIVFLCKLFSAFSYHLKESAGRLNSLSALIKSTILEKQRNKWPYLVSYPFYLLKFSQVLKSYRSTGPLNEVWRGPMIAFLFLSQNTRRSERDWTP